MMEINNYNSHFISLLVRHLVLTQYIHHGTDTVTASMATRVMLTSSADSAIQSSAWYSDADTTTYVSQHCWGSHTVHACVAYVNRKNVCVYS